MAHERGAASSQDDFITKLLTFAVAQGWTQDRLDTVNDQAAMSKGNIFVQFEWDGNDIGVHQSLGFINTSTDAGDHTDDSGNGGLTSSTRAMNDIGNGAFTSYDFFAGTEGGSDYLYAVLEYTPGFYRHFGAGELIKAGDWTGGEFCACTTWNQSAGVISSPAHVNHSVMMDAVSTFPGRGGTIHMEGLVDQTASEKWGVYVNGNSAGSDSGSNTRYPVFGGIRSGPHSAALGAFASSLQQGFVPTILVPAFRRRVSTSPNQLQYLGYHPGIRVVNMTAFDPGATFAIGGNTWQVFPAIRKGSSGSDERSGNLGLAYKR